MKNVRVFALGLILCLMLTAFCPAALADDAPDIKSKNAIVIDMNSGTVMYEKDADSKASPASTTKIMTMLLVCEALERGDIKTTDSVKAQEADLKLGDDEACTAKIKAGEVLSLYDLCCCAMLISANDACNVIASHTAGSVENFVELMNEKAAELGCTGTHFANTNGLPSSEHYTTARELAIIAQEALKHDLFRELCGMAEYTVPANKLSKERKLSNSNALINPDSVYGDQYTYDGAYGIKTGHTDSAGYCLVSAVSADKLDMLAVTLGADGDKVKGKYFNSFGDTIKLLDYCREHWKYTVILRANEKLGEMPVEKGTEDFVSLSLAHEISRLLPVDFAADSLQRTVNLNTDSVTAPVERGTVLGSVDISNADGELLLTADLVAADDVQMSLISCVWSFIRSNLKGIVITLTVIAFTVFALIYLPNITKGKKKK